MPRSVVSFVLLLVLGLFVDAQNTGGGGGNSTSPTATPSLSLSLTTGVSTVVLATTVSGRAAQITTVVPGIVSNVTYTITPSPSTPAANATGSPTPTPTPDPYVLATKVDPAFAVLGVILILTGLPSAFWGHKNRWTSFFLIGFYTLSLVCIVLIFKFGVIPAVHPPSQTVRGMFVLASTIAGFAGGAIAIFFWKAARYGIGAWGGFAFALWVQCFRNGGVIRPIGYRWILNIGCGVIGFMLATIPKIHYHIVLISTAIVGASSFILGVDCFTTAGLKEFYIWNLGFPDMFPKYKDHGIQFPVTQQMQIELGLIGAITLMGIAVQFRVLKVLQNKMREIAEENRRVDEEAEMKAADKVNEITRERDEWEKEHGGGYDLGKHGRQESNLSSLPLLKHLDDSTPSPEQRQEDSRRRNVSGLSEFMAAPTSDEDFKRATRHTQPAGSLPVLDLGLGIEEEVPSNYIAKDVKVTAADIEALKRKQDLLIEIQTLRRSIDVLKTESSPSQSIAGQSRRPSLTSKRTISFDTNNALLPLSSHARPPRGLDPRARVHSLELSSMMPPDPISRPNSVPLKDADWDKYIQERKLLQPPSGITPPIATSGSASAADRVPVAPAVQEALQRRKQRESVMASGGGSSASSEDIPLVRYAQQQQQQAQKSNAPFTILPPRRSSGQILAPVPRPPAPARTRTFEELNERHREKMRDLQAPLTQATKERAELEAAKQRWERAKAMEKEAVTRRQAEKAAALEKDKKKKASSPDGDRHAGGSKSPLREDQHRDSFRGRSPGGTGQRDSGRGLGHTRSLSAEMLGASSQGAMPASSKRLSVMKVEDWQRYQEVELGQKNASSASPGPNGRGEGSGSKRDSRAMRQEGGVPFPHEPKPTHSRRKSRDVLN